MKKILFMLIFIVPLPAQAQFTDDFSDGDFTTNPVWTGDAAQFTVNASHQLQLSSSGTGVSFLSAANVLATLDSTEWHFWIRQNFSPSSSNYGRVYLVSDQSNLEGPLNGYYLQFGESLSNDAVELFRQSGSTSVSVCRGTNARIANAFAIGVRVTRSSSGLWNLFVDGSGGTNYIPEASGTDVTFTASSFLGVVCSYTSSNAANFFFDNFYAGPIEVDTVPPAILSAVAVSASLLDVRFSESVDKVSSETQSNYSVDNGLGSPVSALRDAADISLVHLSFSGLFASGVTHTVVISNVKDIAGNAIASNASRPFTYYQTATAVAGDILFNEVLFNARSGGVEFVELYNASQKVIDVKDLRFTREDLTTHILDAPVNIASVTHLMLPGDYLVLSDDGSIVKSQYTIQNPDAFLDMNLPDLLTTEDILVLLNPSSQEIDRLHYDESWHFPLLNTFDGISLERISFYQPTQLESNWHSAAETVGFATPGYQNSQFVANENDGSEVKIVPEIFSPDEDGRDDVMSLYYTFGEPGYVANANVYDARGRLIRKMAENVLLGTEGSLLWDGLSDDHEKARTGIYVVCLEVFSAKGDVKKYKRSCVVATKL